MNLHEEIAVLMAKERTEDAMHFAELRRALRHAQAPRRPVRVRLGVVLVRLGHWIMGASSPAPRTPIELRQSQS